mgnify:CR=1 FL=1
MKIRNILSVLFVGLLFTSCNSEEEVQRGNEDGRDISFSMTLTLGCLLYTSPSPRDA